MTRSVRAFRGKSFRLLALVLAVGAVSVPLWSTAQAADTVDVQILAFNDFHGQLELPTGNVGGQAAGGIQYFATHIATMRAANPNTAVVSAGDLIGGSPLLSGLFHDEATVDAMNLLGLDFEGVGNHDFDEGVTELHRMQDGGCHPVDGCLDGDGFTGASFKFLSANVRNATTHETVFPPYGIKTFGGVKVAFIGVTLKDTPKIVSPSGIAGYEFLDEADTVNALVPVLQAQGIHTIVVLMHQSAGSGGAGTNGYNLCGSSGSSLVARFDPEIDAVISGHSHTAYNCVYNGVPVTQALSQGKLITQLNMTISTATGNPVSMLANNRIVTRTVTPDAGELALVAKYQAVSGPISARVVGSITEDILRSGASSAGETPLGDLVADSHLWAGKAQGAQMAVMNNGGIRTDLVYALSPGGEQPGQVTYGELFGVQPFSNNLVTATFTGTQIDRLLEQQFQGGNGTLQVAGITYTQYRFRPAGDRIDLNTIRIGGVPITATGTYRVVGNSFLMDGGDGYLVLAEGTDRTGGMVDSDATAAYFGQFSPISRPVLNRITRIDSATAVDLGVSISGPTTGRYGNALTQTFTVLNDGPAAAAGVTVTSPLPAGLTFVSASSGGTFDAGTKTVTWSLGSVAALASASVTLTTRPNAIGPAATSVSVATTSTDPGTANNSDTETIAVAKADTGVALTSSHNPAGLAQPVTWTATVAPAAPGTGTPSGAVQFKIDGNDFGAPVALDATGKATSSAIGSLLDGPHTITAVYAGDGVFNGSTGTLSQAVLPPSGTTSAVLAALQAVGPTGNKDTDKKIADAIKHLTKSLDPKLWDDPSHPDAKGGKKVFDELGAAVKALDGIKAGAPAGTAGWIDELLASAHTIAETAIDDAVAGNAKPKRIEHARKEMAKADGELARGRLDKAIDHWEHAWHHVTRPPHGPKP